MSFIYMLYIVTFFILDIKTYFHVNYETVSDFIEKLSRCFESLREKRGRYFINSVICNITLQILISYCHILLIAETGRILPTDFMFSDHILYSHD